MDIYSDYGNWKFENFSLVTDLINIKSSIISRFLHVISVIDFLYDKRINTNTDLPKEEEVIFESAFNYIHDHFSTIQMIFKKIFKDNLSEMDKLSKTINLLLYTNDFQNELMNTNPDDKKSYQMLCEFEEKVLKFIEDKEDAPDAMFALLSDLTTSMFDEYYSVNEIMYDVAIELGIVPDEDIDDEEEFDL